MVCRRDTYQAWWWGNLGRKARAAALRESGGGEGQESADECCGGLHSDGSRKNAKKLEYSEEMWFCT